MYKYIELDRNYTILNFDENCLCVKSVQKY